MFGERRATWASSLSFAPQPVPSWIAPQTPREASQPPVHVPSLRAPVILTIDEDTPASARSVIIETSVNDRPRSVVPVEPDLRPTVEALEQALAEAFAAAERARRDVLEESKRDLVRLACAIARRVVGRELALDPLLVARWAREAVTLLADQDDIVIAVGAELSERVSPEILAKFAGRGTVVVDPALAPTSCEVRTRTARVDASFEARLANVVDALGEEEPDDA